MLESSSGCVVQFLTFNDNVMDCRYAEITDSGDDATAMEKMEQVIQTNFTGMIHVTRKTFPLMNKSDDHGMIINISSVTGHSVPAYGFKFNVYPGTKVRELTSRA
jgi:NADP-dependent 3-hydroxy acid dehydrogenase YdfG